MKAISPYRAALVRSLSGSGGQEFINQATYLAVAVPATAAVLATSPNKLTVGGAEMFVGVTIGAAGTAAAAKEIAKQAADRILERAGADRESKDFFYAVRR